MTSKMKTVTMVIIMETMGKVKGTNISINRDKRITQL